MNDKAEIRVIEPYAHGQFTESKASPFEGRSHVHWLTGTASTVMVGCVEGICGMRPDLEGLVIAPCLFRQSGTVLQLKKLSEANSFRLIFRIRIMYRAESVKLLLTEKSLKIIMFQLKSLQM